MSLDALSQLRFLVAVAVMFVGCGSNPDDLNCSWQDADRRNAKGEAPAGACNICTDDCASRPWGFWAPQRDDPGAKLSIDEPPECSTAWIELETREEVEQVRYVCEEE